MYVALRKRRKLPLAPARGLGWVGEDGVTVTDSKIKPDLDRFARLPPHVLARLKEVERDNDIIPGQKFADISVTDNGPDVTHNITTAKGKTVSIHLQKDTFRRIAGIREFADFKNSYMIRKVDIRKNPEKSLGFYICEGDGWDRQDGIFVSRLVLGSYIEANNFLKVGDEIMKVNEVYVDGFTLNDVALMMQVVEKLVLTVKVLTSVSHMRRHSARLAITSNSFSTGASLSSTQFASLSTENATPQPQATTDRLTEKVDSGTPDPQTNDVQHTELKHDTSVGFSVSQALDEGYNMLDNSTLTVDMHNSVIDVNKDASQVHEMDVSSTAVIDDVSESTANDTALPENSNEQVVSDSASGSGDTDMDNGKYDETDFPLFHRFKKRKMKRLKKISQTNDTYEVKKSFWQMQEESIPLEDKIDPIRGMEDTNTTFTGKEASEMKTYIKVSEEVDSRTSSTSPDHNKSPTDPLEVTIMIKVKELLDISSFTPQDLFCCIFVDDVKKASTNVKAVQGSHVHFNEQFFIDISGSSELRIMICKPAEVAIGAVEHILSARTIKLPGVKRKPEEYLLEIISIGVLTIDIQVLPLESVVK